MPDTDIKPVRGSGPLSGIKVLDLSAYIAGPYGCTLLADFGADVIKVEPPTGDTLRHYPSTLAGESRAFLGTNRSKRGIVLDLKKPAGLRVLLRLVQQTDVLVHNFRPSVPPRLGIDYDSRKAINPRLIYCGLTGYSGTGPLKDKAGYDQVLQSISSSGCGDNSKAACSAATADRNRVGDHLWRESSLWRRAPNRGHVRLSPDHRAGDGCYLRSPGGWRLSRSC